MLSFSIAKSLLFGLFHLYYKSEILLLFRAMKEIWLEKYRPKKLSDVFGNT